MKKGILLLLVFGMLSFISGNLEESITEIAHGDLNSASKVEHVIESLKKDTSLKAKAYLGYCETIMAQYYFFPTSKWKTFDSGRKKIEMAIQKNNTDVELRYIRLMVQLNAPSFLGYDDNIKSDMTYFNKELVNSNILLKWKKVFVKNLLKSSNIDDSIKALLLKLQVRVNKIKAK